MTIVQILQQEINESNKWLDREQEESVYKRELKKRIELLNWVLENMKKPDIKICDLIESEADKFHIELRILDWIFYQVCSNEIKRM